MFDQFVPFYDADYGSFSDDLVFYREMARMAGRDVLELMCGTGRVAIPLAQAKLNVVGLDIAPAMIERAHAKAKQAGAKSCRFEVADVRNFALAERFDFAFIAINSFMHLETTADHIATLSCIYQHLKPHGMLAIDLFNPSPSALTQPDGLLVYDKTFVLPESGNTVQKFVLREVDFTAQQQHVTFIYDETHADGRLTRTSLPFGMRWLYRYELEHLLVRTGFALESVYGSYDLDPYEGDAPRLLAVARRVKD